MQEPVYQFIRHRVVGSGSSRKDSLTAAQDVAITGQFKFGRSIYPHMHRIGYRIKRHELKVVYTDTGSFHVAISGPYANNSRCIKVTFPYPRHFTPMVWACAAHVVSRNNNRILFTLIKISIFIQKVGNKYIVDEYLQTCLVTIAQRGDKPSGEFVTRVDVHVYGLRPYLMPGPRRSVTYQITSILRAISHRFRMIIHTPQIAVHIFGIAPHNKGSRLIQRIGHRADTSIIGKEIDILPLEVSIKGNTNPHFPVDRLVNTGTVRRNGNFLVC